MTKNGPEPDPAHPALEALLGEAAKLGTAIFGLATPTIVASSETETTCYDAACAALVVNPDWIRALDLRLRDDDEVHASVLLAVVVAAAAGHLAEREDATEKAQHVHRAVGLVLAKIGCPRPVFDRALPILVDVHGVGEGTALERARWTEEGYAAHESGTFAPLERGKKPKRKRRR